AASNPPSGTTRRRRSEARRSTAAERSFEPPREDPRRRDLDDHGVRLVELSLARDEPRPPLDHDALEVRLPAVVAGGEVDLTACQGLADGHEMRHPPPPGRRHAADALALDQPGGRLRHPHRSLSPLSPDLENPAAHPRRLPP